MSFVLSKLIQERAARAFLATTLVDETQKFARGEYVVHMLADKSGVAVPDTDEKLTAREWLARMEKT